MVSHRTGGVVPAAPATDVFGALADQRRRDILGMLLTREMSIQAIASNFEVTRPAVVKHLAVLERAKLVRTRRQGRERLYRLEAVPLRAVHEWLVPFGQFWATGPRRPEAQPGGAEKPWGGGERER